jgi:RNA polymerase sigma factor (sigma-70 family)
LAAVPAGRAAGIEGKVAPEADATRALYERYSGQIFGYCLHRLGNREEAEDAVQSTFLNAFRGLTRGVVPQSDSAWLFKIAENVCHSRHRSSWRRGRIESPSDLGALQDILPAPPRTQEELIPLGEALERLPENQRRAILLREWQGLSYREIGEELDLSQSAVETPIFRARRSLVESLESPLPRRPSPLRRAGHGLDAGGMVGALKVFFAGGAAVKVAAVAVVVTGATVAVGQRHQGVRVIAAGAPPAARVHVKHSSAPAVARTPVPPAATRRVTAPPRTPFFAVQRNAALRVAARSKQAAPKHQPPASAVSPPSAPTVEQETPPVVTSEAPLAPAAHEAPPPEATTTTHEAPPAEQQPMEEPRTTAHHDEPTTTTRTADTVTHEPPPPDGSSG